MPASPRTVAGRALLGSHFVTLPFTEAVRHKRAAFVDAILAIEAEAAQKTAPLDVETALRVMDKLIEIHDCRDPDMGVPCSFHAREHRLLADVIYEEVARLAPAQARPADAALREVADIVKRHTHQGIWAMTRFAGDAPEEDCLLCRTLVAAGILTLDQIGRGTREAMAEQPTPAEPEHD